MTPNFFSVDGIMRNKRKKTMPKLPQTIQEINIDKLPPEIRNFKNEQFLFMEGNVLMMATQKMLDLLATRDCIFMDGTFRVAPALFTQLYTLHGLVGSSMVCFAYFLLPDKSQATYIKMLQMVQSRTNLNPSRFQTDFEIAAMTAVRQLFPAARVSGCFFHYTQCIWRKVQYLGLSGE
jgi:MULE transposase domain